MKRHSPIVIHVLVLLGVAVLALGTAQAGEAPTPSPERERELVRMVRQDCGSCHGMTFKGGLGPALLPADLVGKPAESLVAVVLDGRPGTPMPGWRPFMSEDEAQWIVGRLQQGFRRYFIESGKGS